jgi:hypothetical protein
MDGEGTYGWSFVSSTFGTICINYLAGRKQKDWKSTGAINLNMYLYFHCPCMVFSAQRVAAGWFGNWSHD